MDQVSIGEILQKGPVVPVVSIEDFNRAVPMAQALVGVGVRVIEVTLRTPVALDAIEAIAKAVPDIAVGAGTVLDADQFTLAARAGAQFIVSPGAEPGLLETAEASQIPLLPGAVTPSEIMRLRRFGYDHIKFFPAENYGGVETLKALAGPFADIVFCPTGGITPSKAESYLALDNVVCVGCSWVTPKGAVDIGDWDTVRKLAAASRSL